MIIGLVEKRVERYCWDFLCKKYGFIKYGFADPIKEIAKIMFDFSEDETLKEVVDERWISLENFIKNLELNMDNLLCQNNF